MADVRVIDHSRDYLRRAENAVERAIAASAVAVQREAKRLVGQFSYPPPSAPGEPPHLRTGTLRRSIDQETFQRGREFIGRVGTNLKYGRYLELGTRKMSMRPYLRPALDNEQKNIARRLRRAHRRIL